MDFRKIIDRIFNSAVSNNYLLHLLLAFFLSSFIDVVIVLVLIILKEVIDKYVIKTKFCYYDIIFGIVGILIYLIKQNYGI